MATNSKSLSSAVLLTDGNERSTLPVTRSLGRRGLSVYVGAETPTSLAGSSRYCTETFVYPSPLLDPEEYTSSLFEAIERWKVNVLFPMTDLAVELIAECQDRLGAGVTIPIPSMGQYHQLSDKYQLTKWAQEQGVPIPHTHFVPDGAVSNVIDRITTWPVVVRPGRSLVKIDGAWKKTGVLYAQDANDLLRLYQEVQWLKRPSLIQERILGEGQGVFGLFDRGKPLALFAHRRLREKPPSGGVSVLRESIALPEPMTSYALRVAQSVDWQGVMMVEFKVDRDTQVPYLMEVNGRFWGSLQLAIDSGLDFPWLLYQFGTTGAITRLIEPYQVGVKSRWWIGDLDHLLIRLRKSDKELSLPPESLSRIETLRTFLWGKDRDAKSEVFRLSDIRPGLFEVATYGLPLLRRVWASLKARAKHVRVCAVRAYWELTFTTGVHRMILKSRLPQGIRRVLVLCTGNICRSPFAAELLKTRALRHNVHLETVSAGLDTTPGHDAYPLAKTTSRGYGIDLDRHRTTPITMEMVAWADLIVVMEVVHVVTLKAMFPEADSKTFLLGHFASDAVTEIHDPYEGTSEDFTHCYSIIAAACDGLLERIAKRAANSVVSYNL